MTSALVDLFKFGKKKIKSISPADFDIYKWIKKDVKFDYYKAMIEGNREDLEELTISLANESLNSVNSQGYTLLEWATVFSKSDWPIDQFLKEKGAHAC
jgi:hypothetical protein